MDIHNYRDFEVSEFAEQFAVAIKDYTGIKDLTLYDYDIRYLNTNSEGTHLRDLISQAFEVFKQEYALQE